MYISSEYMYLSDSYNIYVLGSSWLCLKVEFDKILDYIRNSSFHCDRQFAQRSRVRKLQYIAELERNVQALQASADKSK